MYLFLLLSMNLLMSLNFTLMTHPLSMGMMLLTQTILISLITGTISQTFWFSYILFLIMLGGMLVLFIYMTSLASNEKFNTSIMLIMINILFISLSIYLITLLDNFTNIYSTLTFDMNNWNNLINLQENKLELIKLYNFPLMNLTLLLVNYLFLTMIIIVKITNINYGPLRQMN
uniref:NADH-ubiquinone oxidoreductase chain 6 n=1 Tax=Madachauliodes sp. TaxID=2900212 RepID=A0A8K1WD17_9NEOP|nr:NADH dehydrogenase subunit 6 [Madachauliodes sp.]